MRRPTTLPRTSGDSLNHEPVLAWPPSAAYRLRKLLRRNRPQVIAAGLVLLTLVGGVIGTTWGLVRAGAAGGRRQKGPASRKRHNGPSPREAEEKTLASSSGRNADDAIEQQIGSKPDLGPQEKTYLKKTLGALGGALASRQGRRRAQRQSHSLRRGALPGGLPVAEALGQRDEARREYEAAPWPARSWPMPSPTFPATSSNWPTPTTTWDFCWPDWSRRRGPRGVLQGAACIR